MKPQRITLNGSEIAHLEWCLSIIGNQGLYYVPKRQFAKRHKIVRDKLHKAWKRHLKIMRSDPTDAPQ